MAFRGKTACGRRQSGQAIPFGIAAILSATLLVLVFFNTSQVTTDKMRLANTADAAVYSGLVWEARALNFQAYTNRAMVANQVSIAQMVSLVSWSRYMKTAARNLNTVLGWVPFLRPFTQTFYQIAANTNQVITQIATRGIPILDRILDVLKKSQSAIHYAVGGTTWDIVREVVSKNDPQFEITGYSGLYLARHARDWSQFTSDYKYNNQLNRKAILVTASRDGFTRDRGWSKKIPTLLALAGVRVYLVKAGETRLLSKGNVNNKRRSDLDWEWKGKDTLSIHVYHKCIKRWKLRTCHEETPLGWGEAYASTTNRDIECQRNWWGGCRNSAWSQNTTAERYADRDPKRLSGYHGIRGYRELSNIRSSNKDPGLSLAVEVSKRSNNLRTSTRAGFGSSTKPTASNPDEFATGMFHVEDKLVGNEIAAVSAAQVYFRRPERRRDGQGEYGSLFNPYWEVHLISPRSVMVAGKTDFQEAAWWRKGVAPFALDAPNAIFGK